MPRGGAPLVAGSERRSMRQGRYVASPLAVNRRRLLAVTPAATPGMRPPVAAGRRRGDARRLHLVGPRQAAAIGPETLLIERAHELDVLRRRGDGAGRRRGRDRRPRGARRARQDARCSSTPRSDAAEAGCRVRRAAPGPLERHFGFGVVRALLEGALRDVSERARARCSRGGRAAGALLLDGACPAATPP